MVDKLMIRVTDFKNVYEAQDLIHRWANKTFPNRNPMASLSKLVMEEIPELLQAIKRRGPEGIEGELADCFILLLDLAEIWHVDVPWAIKEKMLVNSERTWTKDTNTGFYNHESD